MKEKAKIDACCLNKRPMSIMRWKQIYYNIIKNENENVNANRQKSSGHNERQLPNHLSKCCLNSCPQTEYSIQTLKMRKLFVKVINRASILMPRLCIHTNLHSKIYKVGILLPKASIKYNFFLLEKTNRSWA